MTSMANNCYAHLVFVQALNRGVREKVKLGHLAMISGILFADGKKEIHGDPAFVRVACAASLKRLDFDCINPYYQHRIGMRLPIEVTVRLFYMSPFIYLAKLCNLFTVVALYIHVIMYILFDHVFSSGSYLHW